MLDWLIKLIPAEARADIESRLAQFDRDWAWLKATVQRLADTLLDDEDGGPPHA